MDKTQAFLLERPDMFILRYFPQVENLENFHLRLIDTVTSKSRALILYPAAHGKTTLVSTLLPIWALCGDPNIRIAIITKNNNDAQRIMEAIHAELLGNEDLIRDFGPFYSEDRTWSLSNINVAKRTIRHKSSTIAAFGAGARTAIGYRTDWTICDDIVTDVNSATPTQREKLREWFNLGPETMMEHVSGKLTVVGTLFHPEDLYHDLRELRYPDTGDAIYHEQREDAIVDEDAHRTLWEDRWPWMRLMAQKAKQGTLDFNKRYRNIAVDPSRMAFREEYIKGGYIGKEKYPGCLDKTYCLGDVPSEWGMYAGFDPAVGVTRHAKFCVHCVIAVGRCREHERCYWIVDVERDQMTLPQQADLIISQHAKYARGMVESRVEANSYQGGLLQLCQERMERAGKQFRIGPHYTTRTNKPDPEIGVPGMSPWFENGKVHIPYGNQESRRKMEPLLDELIQYPGRNTDTVMALWFAWLAAEESAPKFKSYNRLHDRPTFWGRKTRRRVVLNPYYEKRDPTFA